MVALSIVAKVSSEFERVQENSSACIQHGVGNPESDHKQCTVLKFSALYYIEF